MAKRNAQGSGSIRQRKDGRWEARYTAGHDPGTGRQIQKSVYGQTQKEVLLKLQQVSVNMDAGTHIEPSKLTVGKWLDIWLEEFMGDKKYLTVKGYKAQCSTHIKPALGAVKLSALSPHEIQRFYNGLQLDSKNKKALAAKSIRNVHGILTKALSQAVQLGYIKTNPAALVTLPRVTKKQIQPLTDEQVRGFLEAVESDIDYGTMLKVILFTGLRESEAVGLTWDCIDFKAGTVLINKQLQKRPKAAGGYTFAPLKNNKSRKLTPAPFVMDLLRQQRKKQAEQRLKAGKAWSAWSNEAGRGKALVFTTAIGDNLCVNTTYNHFKKLAVQIGAENATVHDLRHTYAVLCLQNGDDIKTLQENLGHATVAFTLDVYGHVSERMKQDSASRMETYIKGIESCKG